MSWLILLFAFYSGLTFGIVLTALVTGAAMEDMEGDMWRNQEDTKHFMIKKKD